MSLFPHQCDDKSLTGNLNLSVVIQFFIMLYIL